jgi:hypothetical protein
LLVVIAIIAILAAGNLMGEVPIWDVRDGKQVGSIQTDAFTSWGIIQNHHYLGGMKGQPPFDKDSQIPPWGHVDVYELSG